MCGPAVTSASTPTTASRRSSSTVVAGLVRSALAKNPGGSRSASTLSPTASAVAGDTAASTTWFRCSVSVQKGSSPNVQCRKMYWPCAGRSSGGAAGRPGSGGGRRGPGEGRGVGPALPPREGTRGGEGGAGRVGEGAGGEEGARRGGGAAGAPAPRV